MSFPKVNISYVNPEAVMIDRQTGKLTRDGQLLARAINALIDRTGGILASAPPVRDYTIATLPDAAVYDYGLVFVTDEAGGATLASSDGTNWRRVADRAIVS